MTTKTRDMLGKFSPAPKAPSHLHTEDWDRPDRPGADCDDCRETTPATAREIRRAEQLR